MLLSQWKLFFSVISASALASPLIAAEIAATISSDLTAVGEWKMEVREKRANGQSLCIEYWTFIGDSGLKVISGKQLVEKRWRISSEEGFDKMYMTAVSATADPDCMNEVVDPAEYPKTESGGFALQKLRASYFLCTPMVVEDVKRKTRTQMWGDNCWATLTPVNKEERPSAD
jgi:hypothetical protein